jgi:PHD/YefM family antitoxin component YafN of YafNO toxin-antitoxin module
MTIQLTEQQQEVLDSAGATPPEVVDPRTNSSYVLVPASEYEAVREVIEDERRQAAIRTVALKNAAGRMNEAQ